MAKKTKDDLSPLEKEVLNIIKKYNREVQLEIVSEDIKSVLQQMTPIIDQMIANKVKQHFVELAEFITSRFSNPEE